MFDKVAGTDRVRQLFTKRMRYEDVKPLLEKDVEGFRAKGKTYWLY
jgi:hypothetical protein